MNGESKKSLFDWFAQVIVPLAAAVAALLALKQRTVAIGLLALAVVSVLVSSVPKWRRWIQERKARKHEENVAALALQDLRDWVHKFYEFSNTERADALSAIVFTRLCQSNQAQLDTLRLAPFQLFADFSRMLAERTDVQKPNFDLLRQSVGELNSLLGLYCNYIVCPLYERVPTQLLPQMLNVYNMYKLQDDLIQFRERFDRFIENYTDFLKSLDRRLPRPLEPQPFGYYFARPKPLKDENNSLASR